MGLLRYKSLSIVCIWILLDAKRRRYLIVGYLRIVNKINICLWHFKQYRFSALNILTPEMLNDCVEMYWTVPKV